MKRPKLKSRTSHLEILQALRQRIVAGELGPGERLPTHLELCRQFSTTAATTQRALDELANAGFIFARGRAGTFVAERPPHRYRFGLAFPGNPGSKTLWGSMWQAIDAEARRLVLAGSRDIKTYYDVSDAGSPGRRALIDDAQANCLAGIFLINRFDTELLAELQSTQRIPLAELSSVAHPGVVQIRIATYISKVLDFLKSQGRKRIGLILSSLHGPVEMVWKRLLDERRLRYEPYWIVSVHPAHPEPARKAAYLMMQQPPDQRPDALIITDDYLVETATAGVADSEVRAPDAVEIVAHCNFPLPPASRIPVTRIGYDMPALLNSVLQVLDEKAAGRSTKTSEIMIDALFESELGPVSFQTFTGRSEMETPALPQPAFTFGQS